MQLRGKISIGVLVCLLATGSLLAQSSRGGLQGTVVDDTGAALPGATAVLSSPILQGTRIATTDGNGKFRFVLLPVGVYKAVFSLSGFQTVEQENLRIPLEGVITIDVRLSSTFTDEVVVTSEAPVIDVTSTTVGSSLGSQVLDNVPVGREFTSITYLATGAVDGGSIRDDDLHGNPSIMGASALENRYVVDQLDTTDAAEGRTGTKISASFIEEIQVKTAGYEAEYGGALGGVINMITKSGGNELHGDVFLNFSNDSLWADAIIPETRGDVKTADEEYDFGFTLGGKLVQDKVWYFVAYNPYTLSQNVVNAIYRPDDTIVQVNHIPRKYERDYLTGKLTWQLDDSNSLTINVLGDPTDVTNNYGTTNFVNSPFAETDMTYNATEGGINYGLSWNSIVTESFFIEATAGHHANEQSYIGNLDETAYQDQTGDAIWTLGAGGSPFFGGAQFVQPRDDRTRDQVRTSLTWFLGDSHEVKAGGGYNSVEYDMWYRMAGPSAAFCAPAIDGGAYELDAAIGDIVLIPNDCDSNGDGVLNGVMMPARAGNRYRLRNGYYYNRNYKNESQGKTTEYNLYLQDSWNLAENFTVKVGLRAESSASEGNKSGSLNPIGLPQELDFGFSDMIAPRVGLVWDPAKNGRSKVFAHYGKFYQSIPLTINVRAFGNENYDFYFYYDPEDGSLPSATNPGDYTYVYRSTSSAVDPDIEPQYLEEYVLGAEYEVMTDLAVGVKYISRSLGTVIEDISVDTGNTYFITNPGATYTVNPATGVPLPEPIPFPEAKRDFEGLEVSLAKRFSNGWQGYASLMWSELKGNYEGLYSRDNQQIDPNITSKFDLPDLLANADGMLKNDREWQFKAYGSYHFDFGLVTGLNMHFLTGSPISKLGAHRVYGLDERFVTPRGVEGRTEDWMNFDLHFSYPFNIGDYQLEATLDVFNLFDEQVAVEVDERWTTWGQADYPDGVAPADEGDPASCGSYGLDHCEPTWGEPLIYSPPQNIRVGLKFSW